MDNARGPNVLGARAGRARSGPDAAGPLPGLPMRAYPQHDLLSVMPFGDYGETPGGASEPVRFAKAVARFAKTCGLTRTQAQDTVNELLMVTESYEPRVAALTTLPEKNKARLIARVSDVRKKLS